MPMEESNVVDMPNAVRPQPDEDTSLEYTIMICNTAIRILNARLIGILALLGAIGMWSLAVIQPDLLRTWSAAGYSIGVLLPCLLVYRAKG